MNRLDSEARSDSLDRVLRVVVPVGLAIALAQVVLVVVGLLARIEVLSASSVMQILLIGVMLWPVYRLEPWRRGVTERVRGWVRSNRSAVAITVVLFLAIRLPFAPDLLVRVVLLPLRADLGLLLRGRAVLPAVPRLRGRAVRPPGRPVVRHDLLRGRDQCRRPRYREPAPGG